MTAENILVLVNLAGAVVLFVGEKLRVDLVGLPVLITLCLTGLFTIEEDFSGFASPAVNRCLDKYIFRKATVIL